MFEFTAVSIPKDPNQPALPALEADFGRVTVMLGSNGTGKSRLLQILRSKKGEFWPDRPVTYVEGGRAIQPPTTVELNRRTVDQFRNLEAATTQLTSLKEGKLADRISHLLILIDQLGEKTYRDHSESATRWEELCRKGDFPEREEIPLDRLFRLFSQILPEITISTDEGKQIQCIKNGSLYQPVNLSDGERQILALLADLAILGDPQSLIIVDEPELSLNAYLAERLWNSIEDALPRATFIYGTHSLSFAMRSNVQSIIVLPGLSNEIVEVSDISEIDPNELRDFLGAIPAILAARSALVVEGRESSFDARFYRWVLDSDETTIVPVGGSQSVVSAVRRVGIWESLALGAKLVGVVDRDYKPENYLSSLERENCHVLKFHEAESYLCSPRIIRDLANRLGIVKSPPNLDDVSQQIKEFFKEFILSIVAQRTFAQTHLKFGVSIDRHALGSINTVDELRDAIRNAAARTKKEIDIKIGEDAAIRIFNKEFAEAKRADKKGNIEYILKIAPGKQLLSKLMRLSGCDTHYEVVLGVSKHLELGDYPDLVNLRKRIHSSLNGPKLSKEE